MVGICTGKQFDFEFSRAYLREHPVGSCTGVKLVKTFGFVPAVITFKERPVAFEALQDGPVQLSESVQRIAIAAQSRLIAVRLNDCEE